MLGLECVPKSLCWKVTPKRSEWDMGVLPFKWFNTVSYYGSGLVTIRGGFWWEGVQPPPSWPCYMRLLVFSPSAVGERCTHFSLWLPTSRTIRQNKSKANKQTNRLYTKNSINQSNKQTDFIHDFRCFCTSLWPKQWCPRSDGLSSRVKTSGHFSVLP